MVTAHTRLDTALVERGLARSRARAAELIGNGAVTVDGEVTMKPSRRVTEVSIIDVAAGAADHWVGRAARKLVGAFDAFDLSAVGKRCLDIGACTGGFTQVLLEQGAATVIALDVGHDQLAPELRGDPRVSDLSGTSVRGLTPEKIGGPVQLAVGDLSFISLRLVMRDIAGLLTQDGEAVLLIKPQFEVGRGRLGRRGVVTSAPARAEAIEAVLSSAAEAGLAVRELAASPVLGGEGNHEYLAHLTRCADPGTTWQAQQVTVWDLVREEAT